MDIPLGNIFEVTINSNRLYSYIEDIMAQLKDHTLHITQLHSSVAALSTSIKDQLKATDYNLDIELEKMRKASQEEVNYVRLFMRDVDKKATDKMAEVENTIAQVNTKIMRVKENIEDDLAVRLSYIDKRISSFSGLQEDQQRTHQEIIQLRETLSETNFRIDEMALNLQSGNKKNKELNEELLEKIHQTEREFKFEAEQIYSMKHSMGEESSLSQGKKKREKKRDTQLFSNIINKIDEVEHSIIRDSDIDQTGHNPRRSNVSNSKIVKSNTNINQVQKSHFSVKSAGKFKQFEKVVMEKLAKLEALSVQKFELFEREIVKVGNKNDVVDEHIGILARKIDKQKFKITEVAENMKRFDDKKIDEKAIENLKNMIKKLSKETEELLETKLSKEVYQKEKAKNIQKMQFLNEFIIEKAEKTEVKKGLAFLEEKIKEIIIVLAEERGSGQDGALKKTPFKCLSCDRDLEIDRSEVQPKMTPKENQANLTRCNTNQMRKRIRMINNTITTNQFDE